MRRVISILIFVCFSVSGHAQDLIASRSGGKIGYRYKNSDTWVIPPTYDYGDDFVEGLGAVCLDGKYGYVDAKGEIVIPLQFTVASSFKDGVARIMLGDKWGVIDKTGRMLLSPKYDALYFYMEGFAAAKLNGKFGFINKKGQEVVPLKYDKAGFFGNGLAAVLLDKKWGYIDTLGTVVVPFRYDQAYRFKNGHAKVMLGNKYGYIDKTGKEVISVIYDRIDDYSEDSIFVNLNGKSGTIDRNETFVRWYPNHNARLLCEKLIGDHLEQIHAYKKSFGFSLKSIKIKAPYLIVRCEDETWGCHRMKVLEYSEGTFDDAAADRVKTVVVLYEFVDRTVSYRDKNESRRVVQVSSYGEHLVYFDVEQQKCVGKEKLRGPNFPRTMSEFNAVFNGSLYVDPDDIERKIKSRVRD